MSFSEYGRTDYAVKLAVPWTKKPLWLVPHARYVHRLLDEGVPRGCIWTAVELAVFYAIDGFDEDDRRKVALLRAHFNTTIVSIEDWSDRG